uniref:Uncharacterized protein n=1 Tax=Phytophthora ramorum TaxID=164328 RepID=H3GYA4_PHYRM
MQPLGTVAVARSSREYREVLRPCGFALQNRMEGTSDEEGELLDLLKVPLYLLNTDGYVKSNAVLTKLREIMAAQEKVLKSQAMSWYEFMMARQFLDESKTFVHRFEFLMANRSRAYHG